jgi:hypothetical protein
MVHVTTSRLMAVWVSAALLQLAAPGSAATPGVRAAIEEAGAAFSALL